VHIHTYIHMQLPAHATGTLSVPAGVGGRASARDALLHTLPKPLRDGTFAAVLKEDATTQRWLSQLLAYMADAAVAAEDARRADDVRNAAAVVGRIGRPGASALDDA
jgi:hypothetical protein